MDAFIQSGLFFRASIFYAGAATVVFLVYLLWLASIRRSHAEEESRPWLQYIGATIVIAFIVVVLQTSPFLGMLPTLLAVIFIPDKLRYHLLAAGIYFCMMLGLTIATRSIDPMDLSEIDRVIYPEHLIDKDISFRIETAHFKNSTPIKIPFFEEFETRIGITSNDVGSIINYDLYDNTEHILSLGLIKLHNEAYKSITKDNWKMLVASYLDDNEGKAKLIELIKEAWLTARGEPYATIQLPKIVQNTSNTIIAKYILEDSDNYEESGYYGAVIINDSYLLLMGTVQPEYIKSTDLFLTIINKVIDIN